MVRKSRKSVKRKGQNQQGGFLGDIISNLTEKAKDAASGIKNIATTAENKLQQGIGKATSGVKHLELKAEEGVKQVSTGAKQVSTGAKHVVNSGIQNINPRVGGKRKTRRKRTKRKRTKRKRTKRKSCKCSCPCKKC
jgi:hypothetical protein